MPTSRPAAGGAGRAPDATLARLSSPVLAARVDELHQLEGVVGRPPAVAVVKGEAGVGKTRLVAELAARVTAEGRRVLVGHCHPLHEPFPLGPVVEALRAVGEELGGMALSPLAGALRPVFPELAWCLPPAPGHLGDRHMERHRLWRALVEVLGALGPAVVVLEDLHWADDATPQFVSFLAAQQPAGLAVVLTARVDDESAVSRLSGLWTRLPGSTTTARVRLGPLGPDDVKVMIGAILETDVVSDEFAAYLHQRTAGIPLAVEEVLRLLVDRKDIVRWRGQWARRALEEVQVPAAIRDSMLERFAALGGGARLVVEAAAVVAEPASEDLLQAVAGLPARRAEPALSAALAVGILQAADGGYVCRHALAAQAVYDVIDAPRRRRLHRRAAEALESTVDSDLGPGSRLPSRLAHHWRLAGEAGPWVRWAQEAATLATTLGDPGTAATLLLDAVSAPGLGGEERGRLALALSSAALQSQVNADAIGPLEQVLADEELSQVLRAKLRANLASLFHQAGDASAAHAQLALAVPDLEGAPEGLARVMFALALPWVLEKRLEYHQQWLERASQVAEGVEDEQAAGMLRGDRAAVLIALGNPAGWEEIPPAPGKDAPLPLEMNRVRVCANLAISAFYLGHDHRAEAFVDEGMGLSETTGYERVTPALRTVKALLAWAGGVWEGAEAAAQEVIDGRPDVPSSVQASMVLGQLALARDRLDEAERWLGDVLARAGPCGALPTLAAAAAAMARMRMAGGDPAGARSVALPALEVLAAKPAWWWAGAVMPVAVETLLACGAADEADEWCRRFALGLRGLDAPAARAALGSCRGLTAEHAGRLDRAAAAFVRTERAWTRVGRPYEAALAAEAQARCLLRSGPKSRERAGGVGEGPVVGAQAVGSAALATFARLGAAWDEARVRRMLRAHGVAVPYPRRTSPPRSTEELSPREQEVVELAAAGLTSTQIGRQLFLSPRTIDHHLERALRKLGVASRKDLIAARAATSREIPGSGPPLGGHQGR